MGYPILNPSAGSADPSLIDGLVGWFRADAITGLDDGDPVSTWTDGSGNGWNATQSADKRPLWRADAGPNATPAVEFDGVDDCMNIASGMAAAWNAATGATIFIVGAINPALSTPQCAFALGANGVEGSGQSRLFLNARGGVERRWRYGSRLGDNFEDPHPRMVGGIADGKDSIVCAWHSCADREVRLYQDGGLKSINYEHGNGNNFNATSAGFRVIGAFDSSGSSEQFDGPISEIIVYNRPLTLSEIAGVTAYLRAKYAIPAGSNTVPTPWGVGDWPCSLVDPASLVGVLDNLDPIEAMDDGAPMGMPWRQPTEASRPLFIASGVNGAPAIRGDGTNDALESQDISTYPVHFQSIMAASVGHLVVIAAVTRASTATAAANRTAWAISTGSATATLAFAGRRQTPANEWGGGGRRNHGDTNTVIASGVSISAGETAIYTTVFEWASAKLAFRKNGVQVLREDFLTAGVTPNNNSALVAILRNTAGGTTHWGGDLYGLIMFRYMPTERGIAEAEAYLADRLAIVVPPWIDTGGSVKQGETKNIVLTGLGFNDATEVEFSGAGVTVNTVTRVDYKTLLVNITVAGDAATGGRDITVTNGDLEDKLPGGLQVRKMSGTATSARNNFSDTRGAQSRGAK